MSVVGSTLMIVLAILGTVAYRRRRDPYYMVLAILGVAGPLVVLAARRGFSGAVIELIELPLVLLVAVVGAQAFGLPASVARIVGFGYRSRGWECERALARVLSPMQEVLLGRSPSGDGPDLHAQARLLGDGRRRVARLRAIRAPDEDWRNLTIEYANVYEAWLNLAGPAVTTQLADLEVQFRRLLQERERLRDRYREEADRFLAGNAGWTSAANAYSSNDTYATTAPNKNSTRTVNLGTFGFDAAIPANATITGVTVTVEWKVSTAASIATGGDSISRSVAPSQGRLR